MTMTGRVAAMATVMLAGGVWVTDPANGPDDGRRIAQQERELIQEVHRARDAYQLSLERLRAYYIELNNHEAIGWVEKELRDYHLIVKQPYSLELDLPAADLRPDQSIPKANQLFREALDWYGKTSFSSEKGENLKRAELLFRRLLREYPRSDKLDEACYYLGEIYGSRYFAQPRRAVAFHERVFLYEPNTNLDARLRAAMVYEKQLSDRRRAIELYQEVLKREFDPRQTREARRHLDELLNTRTNPNRQP